MVPVMADLNSFRAIIDLWPSREAMAVDVGAGPWAVRKWLKRNNIPSEWWSVVLATELAASKGLTAELFTEIAAREPAEVRA